MGDFTRCRSSPPRTSAVASDPAVVSPAGTSAAGTMISAACLGAAISGAALGFLSRIFRSPLEYSNSSRLCSLMKRSNCSICPISGVANDELALDFDGFFRFMPLSDLDEIPLYAGEDFIAPGLHCNDILNADAAHAFHINTRFY